MIDCLSHRQTTGLGGDPAELEHDARFFIAARVHRNEQDKFVEDLRKGCSNLIKHTKTQPDTVCPVLFVRLCANASFANCAAWARDYFANSPNERVGLILLYQAVVVTTDTSTSLAHYLLPILGAAV